ncbi:MAG: helix-turn-helix domain-containing protein [Acidobacteria bacterium]|nr:helix-turn-helix domain-containing protein [Acidobacteriota bacterium]
MTSYSGVISPYLHAEGLNPVSGARPQMLIPQTALRILCQRTGGTISRSTFYRWVECGKIPSIRLGARIFIPRPALDNLIQKCFDVD